MGLYDSKPWTGAYDEGVGLELEIPNEPVTAGYERIRQQFPDRPAFHFFGVTWTFEQLFQGADRFARALADRDIGKDDVVAINLPNLPQWLIAQLGAARMGCWVCGISPLLQAEEMAFQLKDSGAKALVTLDPIFEHRLKSVSRDLPDLKFVVPTGILDFLPRFKQFMATLLKKIPTGKITPLPGKEVLPFMDVLKTHEPNPPRVDVSPEDVHLLQYTGGTTGVPKGAMLTHRNVLSQTVIWNTWFHMDMGKDVACSGYPFFHVGGQCAFVASLWHGATQILIPNPRDTKHIVKEIARYRPHFINNVPSLYMLLMNTPGFKELDFTSVRFATSAAAPFPVEPMKELEALIGEGRVVELYGLTETAPMITLNPTKGNKKIGSVGIPAPSTEVRLVDLETGEVQVPRGEKGELIVRGPQVMKGYWNNPGETSIAMRDHDGKTWFHTGDIAVMDEEGYFTIVDRSKDMINVSGFKVFPREVEEKLYAHPAIEVCAVLGMDNPERPGSELVKLVFQKSEAYRETPDEEVMTEIRAFCEEHMGAPKKPRVLEIVAEMPMTAAGKVDRKALR
ncbi:MAG: AMP-binding protein [Deltaproteobacteria bacterium]|nr:AMP-binding protein [Deltaproteobacteria bacterium]MBW1942588.1 AMP-binding protein [Deltaproteobacteria bacterium]